MSTLRHTIASRNTGDLRKIRAEEVGLGRGEWAVCEVVLEIPHMSIHGHCADDNVPTTRTEREPRRNEKDYAFVEELTLVQHAAYRPLDCRSKDRCQRRCNRCAGSLLENRQPPRENGQQKRMPSARASRISHRQSSSAEVSRIVSIRNCRKKKAFDAVEKKSQQ